MNSMIRSAGAIVVVGLVPGVGHVEEAVHVADVERISVEAALVFGMAEKA